MGDQAEEFMRFAREHSDAERDAFNLLIGGRENFEAGTTTS